MSTLIHIVCIRIVAMVTNTHHLDVVKPYRVKGKIMSISKKDWEEIDKEVKWLYSMQNKPQQ